MSGITKVICKCGKHIEQARLDATKGQAKTCISCMKSNDVEKVAGFPIISGKNTYSEIQILPRTVVQALYKKQERKGQSPSAGMKY